MTGTVRQVRRSAVALWAGRGSGRRVIMGVAALVALLAGCGPGGQIDTSMPTDTVSPAVSPTTAQAPASTAPDTSAPLPSGATVEVIAALSVYDKAPAVLALRAWMKEWTGALLRMDPRYGPLAQAGSGPLLANGQRLITQYRAKGIELHGAFVYKIVSVNRLSPTRVRLDICSKDDAAWFVYPDGKPVQGVVTHTWSPHQYAVDLVAHRWVVTNSASQKTSCAGVA